MGQNSVQVQVQPEGKKEGISEEATPRGALKNGREFDWRSRGRAVQAERTADQRLPTEGSAWPPAAPCLSQARQRVIELVFNKYFANKLFRLKLVGVVG